MQGNFIFALSSSADQETRVQFERLQGLVLVQPPDQRLGRLPGLREDDAQRLRLLFIFSPHALPELFEHGVVADVEVSEALEPRTLIYKFTEW